MSWPESDSAVEIATVIRFKVAVVVSVLRLDLLWLPVFFLCVGKAGRKYEQGGCAGYR